MGFNNVGAPKTLGQKARNNSGRIHKTTEAFRALSGRLRKNAFFKNRLGQVRCGLIPITLVLNGLDLRRQSAGRDNLELGTKFDLFTELMQQFVFLLEVAGFNVQVQL